MNASVRTCRVVLVRPRNPGNMGACARAMGNFGLKDLVVVDPFLPIWQETRSAPDAETLVQKARKTATLAQALKGCSRVLGTSSLAHRRLEHAVVSLPQLAEYLSTVKPAERVALVFGSERSGLSNEELSACEAVIQIPMALPGVSMNLAQAVAVILYEWNRSATGTMTQEDACASEKNAVVAEWIRLAGAVGYPPGYTAAARAGRIRKAMHGVRMRPDTALFLKSFSRWLLKKSN